MLHHMKLRPHPFSQIRSGEKTVELRLNDEKRREIRIGDEICFTEPGSGKTLTVRVTQLHPFPSFAELFAALGTAPCGGYVDMDEYYPPAEQARLGVLGIAFEPVQRG